MDSREWQSVCVFSTLCICAVQSVLQCCVYRYTAIIIMTACATTLTLPRGLLQLGVQFLKESSL